MSTKPCPQCGSAVPLQARFCGQCGRTFGVGVAADPATRAIPTTLDEATVDEPGAPPASSRRAPMPVPAPVPRAHAGLPTAIGHAAVPVPAPGLGMTARPAPAPAAPPPAAAPAPAATPGVPDSKLGKTMLDAQPYATSREAALARADANAAAAKAKANANAIGGANPLASSATGGANPLPASATGGAKSSTSPGGHGAADAGAGSADRAPPSIDAAFDQAIGAAFDQAIGAAFDNVIGGAPEPTTAPPVGPVSSQRPTPMVPPPTATMAMGTATATATGGATAEQTLRDHLPPKSKPLGATALDPFISERAQQQRDLAIAEAKARLEASQAANVLTSASPAPPQAAAPIPAIPIEEITTKQPTAPGGNPSPAHPAPAANPSPSTRQGTAPPQAAAPAPRAPAFGKTLVLGTSSADDYREAIAAAEAAAPPSARSGPTAGAAPPPPPNPMQSTSTMLQSAPNPMHSAAAAAAVAVAGSHAPMPPGSHAPVPGSHAPMPPGSQPMAPTAAGSDKRTMLGMPAVDLPAFGAPGASAPNPSASDVANNNPNPSAVPPVPPGLLPSGMKTMIGVAIPGIAPTPEPPIPIPNAPRGHAGTLMGVAAPGIAPIHPGDSAPHQPAMQPSSSSAYGAAGSIAQDPFGPAGGAQTPPPPPILPAPAPLVFEPLPDAPQLAAKKGIPATAVLGIIFVVVALIGTGAAFVMLRSGPPLTAQPLLDESGKESLKIGCESCPDGTMISLGASSAKVDKAAALLPLPAPLSIGDNDLEIAIDRPASGRDETVKIHVPVAYRVKADLSTLTASPPTVTVRAEATPGTEVTVDGKPITLDASGRGSYALDVSADVEGPSDDQKALDRKIPFTIKSKGAKAPEAGQLVVRAAVIPLHVDAPGRELFTDRTTTTVAGQTRSGGTLTIDGQGVAVDPQGRFGVRVELPAEGEKTLTLVANAPPLAPRTMKAKVIRVGSLEAAAKTLDGRSPAPLAFDAISTDPAAHVGKLVFVEGEVVEARAAQGHTVILIEEKKGCAGNNACFVRVVHGEELKTARGDAIRAWGRLSGTVNSGGKTVPDLEGSLVITQPQPKKK